MSRRKIKAERTKKREPGFDVTPRQALKQQIQQRRDEMKAKERRKLFELIGADPDTTTEDLAEAMGWSESKVKRTLVNAWEKQRADEFRKQREKEESDDRPKD